MSKPSRIVTALAAVFAVCFLVATGPAHDYSNRTVAQLLELLESKDASVRQCAATYLGDRYSNPNPAVPSVDGPSHGDGSPPPELPIPPQVIPRLAEHLKSDPDVGTRICAVAALRDLKFRTDTTPILMAGLDDQDEMIQIRTCDALIHISHDYAEPLADRVIPTLTQCLSPEGKADNIWQAAYTAEQLGAAGKPLMPVLQKLTEHQSSKVRYSAQRALSAIEQAIKKKA